MVPLGERKVMGTQCDLNFRSTCWNLDLCMSPATGLSLCVEKLKINWEVSPRRQCSCAKKGACHAQWQLPCKCFPFCGATFPGLASVAWIQIPKVGFTAICRAERSIHLDSAASFSNALPGLLVFPREKILLTRNLVCFLFFKKGGQWLQEFKNWKGKYQIILLIFEL